MASRYKKTKAGINYYQGWINYNIEKIGNLRDRLLYYCNGYTNDLSSTDILPGTKEESNWYDDVDKVYEYKEKADEGVRLTKEEMIEANRIWKRYSPYKALRDLPSLRDLRDQLNNS